MAGVRELFLQQLKPTQQKTTGPLLGVRETTQALLKQAPPLLPKEQRIKQAQDQAAFATKEADQYKGLGFLKQVLKEIPLAGKQLGASVGFVGGQSAGEVIPEQAQTKLYSPTPQDKAEALALIQEATATAKPKGFGQKYSQRERQFVGGTVSGATGNIIPQTEPATDISGKILSGAGQLIGMASTLGKINSGLEVAISKTPILKTLISKAPRVAKFATDVASFDVYGQLNPELGADVKKRMIQAGKDTILGLVFETAGIIPKAQYRIPAAAAIAYSAAKMEGENNGDALLQAGLIGALGVTHEIIPASEKFRQGFNEPKNKLTQFDTPEIITAREQAAKIPETIKIATPERDAFREQLATDFYGNGAEQKNHRADIVLGAPSSGKSTALAEPLAKEHGALIIDSDQVKKSLPEFQNGVGSGSVHKESALISDVKVLSKALENGDNIVLPRLGKNTETMQKLVIQLNNAGYDVHLHYMDLPSAEAAKRVVTRFNETGRFVDPDYVLNVVDGKPREVYNKIKQGKEIKSYESYSNEVPKGQKPELLERGGAGVTPTLTARGERLFGRAGSENAGELQQKQEAEKNFLENINLDKFPPELRDQAKAIADNTVREKIQVQRRGVMTDAKVNEAANNANVFVELLTPGTALNAEQMQSARMRATDLLLDAVDASGHLTQAGIEKASQGLIGLGGVTAESGRALRVFKSEIPNARIAARIALKAAENTTDPVLQEALINGANLLVKGQHIPGFLEKFIEYSVAAKLTNMRTTPLRAITGNVFASILRLPEEILTVGVGKVRRVIVGGPPAKEARTVVAEASGMMHGVIPGMQKALEIMIGPESAMLGEARVHEVMDKGAIGGTLGKVIRFPFRIVGAIDAPFREINRQGSLAAMATEQGLRKGLKGVELSNFVADLLEKPSPQLQKAAAEHAKEFIFQKDLTGTLRTLNKARQAHSWLKIFVPFFKTPADLARYAMERTPLSPLMPSVRKAIQRGGADADRAYARMAIGGVLSMGTTMLALQGFITGKGPDNANERDILRLTGWQPYSIKIGNHYVSYSGFEPVSTFFALGASISDEIHHKSNGKEGIDNRALRMVSSVAENWTNAPYLIGLQNLLSAIISPDRSFAKVAGETLGGLIPTGVADVSHQIDPVVRDTNSILEVVQSKIPFLSKNLPPARDLFGTSLTRESMSGITRVLPFAISSEKNNTVADELLRLGMNPGQPGKTLWKGQDMSTAEYDNFIKLEGSASKIILQQLIQTPAYQKLDNANKEKMINSVISSIRAEVKKSIQTQKLKEIVSNAKEKP